MQSEENLSDESAEVEDIENNALEEGDQSDKQEEADTSTDAQEESKGSSDDDSEGTAEETAESKPKGSIQKRFDRLTARAKTAESERDYWKNLAQEKTESVDKPVPPKLPDPNLRFEDPEEYQKQETKYYEDLDNYNQSSYKYAQHQASSESIQKENEAITQELQEAWGAKVSEVSKQIPDWEKLVTAEANPVSLNMAEVAMRSDKGPEVLYELAKNPEVAKRIYHMNPVQTAYEMGKIESRLAVKPKTKTAAPDPVSTVTSSGESANKSAEDMSIDEYMKMERKKRLANFS